mgnify:CR=1 FL=1
MSAQATPANAPCGYSIGRRLSLLLAIQTVIGLGVWDQVVDMSLEKFNQSILLNLTSFFLPARAVGRSLLKNGKPGAIACVSSVSGLTSGSFASSAGASPGQIHRKP